MARGIDLPTHARDAYPHLINRKPRNLPFPSPIARRWEMAQFADRPNSSSSGLTASVAAVPPRTRGTRPRKFGNFARKPGLNAWQATRRRSPPDVQSPTDGAHGLLLICDSRMGSREVGLDGRLTTWKRRWRSSVITEMSPAQGIHGRAQRRNTRFVIVPTLKDDLSSASSGALVPNVQAMDQARALAAWA